MASLADVFRVLEEMREACVFTDYAIGDATAVLFYAEPTRMFEAGQIDRDRLQRLLSTHRINASIPDDV